MSFAGPIFQHDIFISFSHGDMEIHAENPHLRTWTYAFIERLREEILLSLGPENAGFNIWYDNKLEGNQPLTPELKKRVESSALLLIVMTPQYLDSHWCKGELQWFETELNRRGDGTESIFVVRAFHTDEGQWPVMLREKDRSAALGEPFYHTPGNQNSRPYGWPKPNEDDREFFEALPKLAGSIIKRLEALRTKPQQTNNSNSTNKQNIYLAWGTDDTLPQQEKLRKLLIDRGISIEPKDCNDDSEVIPIELNQAIQNSDLYIQLFGLTAGQWERESTAPVIHQYNQAKNLSKPILTWREPEMPLKFVRDQQYRQLIESSQPSTASDMNELADEIINTLETQLKPKTSDVPVVVYLEAPADKDAEQKRLIVKKHLEQLNCQVFPISHQPVEGDLKKITAERIERFTLYLNSDAVILLHTNYSGWINNTVMNIIRYPKIRKAPNKLRCAILDMLDDQNLSLANSNIKILHWNQHNILDEFARWIKASAPSIENEGGHE